MIEFKPLWVCDCGKKYRSQIALELCESRNHTPLPEKKKPIAFEVAVKIERFVAMDSGEYNLKCQTPYCGKSFHHHTKLKRFCDGCLKIKSNEYQNRKNRERKIDKPKLCIKCGGKVYQHPGQGRPNTLCAECKVRKRNEYAAKLREAKRIAAASTVA